MDVPHWHEIFGVCFCSSLLTTIESYGRSCRMLWRPCWVPDAPQGRRIACVGQSAECLWPLEEKAVVGRSSQKAGQADQLSCRLSDQGQPLLWQNYKWGGEKGQAKTVRHLDEKPLVIFSRSGISILFFFCLYIFYKDGQIAMVRTSKTDHFFKLAPFRSPLTALIDFGIAGKLLTSATRWCSPFVDSVSRIWIKPKKSLIGCWAPTATIFGQSAPSPVQLTAGRNGHNRHFEGLSLVSSVCRSLCTGKIELYVSWASYFRGVLPWLQRTAVKPVGFACTGTISRVIVKATVVTGFCSSFPLAEFPFPLFSVILLRSKEEGRECYFVKRPRRNTRTQQIYA